MLKIDELREMIEEIGHLGRARHYTNLERRLLKVFEEIGELTEAWLNTTCPVNYKKKTSRDIREEGIDCLIVLIDCALTHRPGGTGITSMLPSIVDLGQQRPYGEDGPPMAAFKISRSVVRALEGFRANEAVKIEGALSNAIRTASKLVFSPMDQEPADVESIVTEIFKTKLLKWQAFLDRKESLDEAA